MKLQYIPHLVLYSLSPSLFSGTRKRSKSSRSFQIGFPMRTNYMYGRVKRTVTQEIYAMTLCMWLKGGASGIGTPFSYSAPGQANELVLIEWGDKPMELLIKDTVGINRKIERVNGVM